MRSLLMPAALIVGLLAPLILSSWYTFNLQRQALEESFRFEIEQLADTLANGMVEPIWFLIPESGRPLLDSFMQDPRILAVTVESIAQGRFLHAGRDDRQTAQSVTLERQVVRDTLPIGSVRVTIDTSFVYRSMRGQWLRIGAAGAVQATIALAVVFIVLWLNSRLQRTTLLQETNRRLQAEIAERKQAQSALERSRDQLRLITDTLPALIVYVDVDRRYRFVNRTCAEWNARPPEEIVGHTVEEVVGEQYRILQPRLQRVLEGEQLTFKDTMTFADGVTRVIQATYVPHIGTGGRVEGFFVLGEDVTELAKAEDRLRQSQKLEAVGQLTGGVAHDFNNLLAVIQGNAELLAEADEQTGSHTRPIIRAAERGSELTQRLLAFSRRQPLAPRTVDLGLLVSGMLDLLTRTLGATIEIETRLALNLCSARADQGQVENALLNLALNARDAMPGGGKLTIACDEVAFDGHEMADDPEALVGDYVVLSVTDTGTGMSDEVKAHAFEPFYTTKEFGSGSGLGLSMVYGFAKQSGGQVTIYSEEGVGTTVRLYLPRSRAPATEETKPRREDPPKGHGEHILVIEDDVSVRTLAVRMLDRLGYKVTDVPEAAEARRVLADGEQVDLMLSDVILPGGVSGPEFAEEAQASRPGMKIVFMSGYPAEAAKRNGFVNSGRVLLSKPFRIQQLAKTVRMALDT